MSRERTSSGSWLGARSLAPAGVWASLVLGLIVGCSGRNYTRGAPDAGGDDRTGGTGPAGSGGAGSGGTGPASGGGAGLASSGGANPGSGGTAAGGRGGTGGTPGSGGAGSGGRIGGSPGTTGGTTGAGGAALSTGGRGTGGTNTGGANTGGANTGGANTGGANTGGANTGGANTGGANTGGANTGGANTGGASTGGMGGTAPAGAILYYRFDETTGTSVADQSGNARTGTVAGGGTFGPGMIQNGLTFLGGTTTATRTFVTIPVGLLDATRDLTISLWVNIQTEQTWQRVFDFGKSSTTGYMFLTTRGQAGMRFAITTTGGSAEQRLDAPALPVGVWKHLALVLGSGGASIFVDGAKAATNAAVALRPADIGAMTNQWLGRSAYAADPYFAGQLDELRVYDRALSDGEIAALYSLR